VNPPAADIELVALDLDGTLLHGDTVSEAIARSIGRLDRMRELEAADVDRAATERLREEVADWFLGHSLDALREPLPEMTVAPGTRTAFQRFRDAGVDTAIVSLSWEFAVEYFAATFGADHAIGTRFDPDRGITDHVWPEDKPELVRDLAEERGLDMAQVAGVGDSFRDVPMLEACGRAYYVGEQLPVELGGARHCPEGDVAEIAADLLGESTSS